MANFWIIGTPETCFDRERHKKRIIKIGGYKNYNLFSITKIYKKVTIIRQEWCHTAWHTVVLKRYSVRKNVLRTWWNHVETYEKGKRLYTTR